MGSPRRIRSQEIVDHPEVQEAFHGLNTVPMTLRLAARLEGNEPISDTAELVPGIMGFELHQDDTFN
jgi:hypothetical protein